MSKYRVTATYTQRVIIEGEGSLAVAEERADELYSGLVTEHDGEVSSYRDKRPSIVVEVCLNDEEDLWAVVNR
jgi:hypothetical protein